MPRIISSVPFALGENVTVHAIFNLRYCGLTIISPEPKLHDWQKTIAELIRNYSDMSVCLVHHIVRKEWDAALGDVDVLDRRVTSIEKEFVTAKRSLNYYFASAFPALKVSFLPHFSTLSLLNYDETKKICDFQTRLASITCPWDYWEIRSEIIQHIDFLKKEAQELESNVEVFVIHVA
jgi:hypothetical protein